MASKASRSKAANKRRQAVPLNRTVFPRQVRISLPYYDATTLATSSTVMDSDLWSANSLYDPYVGAGGHQPLGFDQWSTFYNHYVVESCTITATYTAAYAGLSQTWAGIFLSDDSTIPTTVSAIMEQPHTKAKPFAASKGGKGLVQVKHHFDARSWYQVRDPVDNPDLSALVNANPTDQAYFAVWFGIWDDSSSSITPMCLAVQLVYNAVFFEPKELAQS